MSANVSAKGIVTKLDREGGTPTPITERDVQNPSTLARILLGIVHELAKTTGRWAPKRTDYVRVVDATGTTKFRFEHGFGGAVRFWVVDWNGAAAPNLRKHSDTDNNTLVLTSTFAGTATIRVEEAG